MFLCSFLYVFPFVFIVALFSHTAKRVLLRYVVPVATSTSHSEGGSIFTGVKYAKYVNNWCKFLNEWIVLHKPIIVVLNDNTSAIQILSNYTNNS